MEHPKILTLNLEQAIIDSLKAKDFSIYNGNIGKITNHNLKDRDQARCLLLSDIPDNFHEYEILIIDLNNQEAIDYDPSEHKRTYNKTRDIVYFECESPQTVFDPRAIQLHLLNKQIYESLSEKFLLIVFCSTNEKISYNFISNGDRQNIECDLYSFIDDYMPSYYNKIGTQIKIDENENEIYHFLKKYKKNTNYEIAFYHPTVHQNNKLIEDPEFYPLMHNHKNEIVSFYRTIKKDSGIFFFPDIKDKQEFITEFLEEIAPSIFPALFPEKVKNNWVNYPDYTLPNQECLLTERQKLKENYEQKLFEKDQQIRENYNKFCYLHDILTKTGSELVSAVIQFLTWLGFENVQNGDYAKEGVLEEDIYIETDRGLLIFEVKGIGSTSKDSDCSQIQKVKFRRSRQRDAFDVFAGYIVNHQRHLPPLDRKFPPFTKYQIEDAENDERFLVTTWQLYNLFFDIENGVLTKNQAIEAFWSFGLLDFIPKSYLKIGFPVELYQGQSVIIIFIPADITIKINDELFTADKQNIQRLTIQSIKVNDKHVQSATAIEAGIKINGKINKNTVIYKIVP